LLSNAVKFSGSGGCVTLRARRVARSDVGLLAGEWPVHSFPVADNEYNEFLEICVGDNGLGISHENMAKLFLAFSQIDSSLARKFEGTGLGLAMVKQLTELHGGTVAVASAEGEGACFAVWLPLRTPEQATTSWPQSISVLQKAINPVRLNHSATNSDVQATNERTHTVLVVDDDPKAVEVIAAFLPTPAFAVVRAYGGSEAITLAQRLRPDLILLDLMMPGVSGLDVVAALTKNVDTAGIPILVVTAKEITALDRATLNSNPGKVIHIVEKAGFNRVGFIAEVKRALLPH
ncbi:MAG: ATP-binding protein, partial [Burkholderiaceae bacterium]